MDIEVVIDGAAALAADAALATQIDALGAQSAVAQKLSRAITSAALFATQPQPQTLFLAREASSDRVIGFLKSGVKHLFYVNRRGEYSELDPVCVLDFFVLETHQRAGVGLQLFERLLQTHRVTPEQLAYDRPSPKLFAFLKKRCGLSEFFPQPNNFVIFDAFFDPKNSASDEPDEPER